MEDAGSQPVVSSLRIACLCKLNLVCMGRKSGLRTLLAVAKIELLLLCLVPGGGGGGEGGRREGGGGEAEGRGEKRERKGKRCYRGSSL